MSTTTWIYNDGGRAAAGFEGKTGDCVCRAVAIATVKPYRQIYEELIGIGWNTWRTYWRDADGLYVPGTEARRREREYIKRLGWAWTSTMRIGQGRKVHLRTCKERDSAAWLAIAGAHGWLCGSLNEARAVARWLSRNFGLPVREASS